ncbi:MAG: hypothetical protein FJ202_10190 [Gemmatimonadetes bacterium]|nr:hypothetical protein [Gemmatimonadota bacterium]
MDPRTLRRREYSWFAAILGISSPLVLSVCGALWRSPYPISETVSLLTDDLFASPLSFFDSTTRSWYRPLFHLTWWGFWRATGSLDAVLFWFTCVEVTAVALLLVLFMWHLRPRTLIEGAAATFAVAVLAGTPGFRENLEIPMLMTLVGMPLALIVWMLLQRDHRPWHGPAIVVLMLIAVGFKEQGLIIAPLVVAAWWTGAPGARRGTTAAVVAAATVYLAMRLATSGSWATFEQDVGLGFERLSAREASERFGAAPLWMYLYNAASTIANILFSEPTDGRFGILWNLSQGEFNAWEINHVLSSTVLTGLVSWWGLRALKDDIGRPWSAQSRLFIAAVLVIAASGALGFNYSRDRLGGMAVVFYAIAAYFAVRAAADLALRASRPGMIAAGMALLLLGGAWQIRAIGTVHDVRLKAARAHREWITDLHERRTDFARESNYLQILEALSEQGLDPASAQPIRYPRWLRAWIGGR